MMNELMENQKIEKTEDIIPFLKEHYKNVDVSDLKQDFDDYIWEDQVDYMPEIDEDKKEIKFSVDMVLEVEEKESDED